jgi:hypothetical protein
MEIDKAQSFLKALGFEVTEVAEGSIYQRRNADGSYTWIARKVVDNGKIEYSLPEHGSTLVCFELVKDEVTVVCVEHTPFSMVLAHVHAFSPVTLADPLLEAVVTIRDLASHYYLDRHVQRSPNTECPWPGRHYSENHRHVCRIALERAGLTIPDSKQGIPALEVEDA